MDEAYKDPVQFSKGINLRDLMSSGMEFKIDTDFKKKPITALINGECHDGDDDDEDSDSEDILGNMERATEKMMLASPEYHAFEELEAKMIDCLPSGDVKILIIEEGDGPLVPTDAEVTIHYAAYWEKANIPFDSSLTMNHGQPMTLTMGLGRFLPGLEIGLSTVRGPTARLQMLVRPVAAWGRMGVPPRIKAETALFVVTLYGVRDTQAGRRFQELPETEQCKFTVTIETVTSLHTIAKEQFKKNNYLKAIKNYQKSIMVLKVSQPETDEERTKVRHMQTKAYLNLAMCHYKLKKPKHILRMLEALDYIIDTEKNCKALFYYGRAYELMNKTEEAVSYYKKASKLEPKNKDIGKALYDLDVYLNNAAVKEKNMWRTVFKTEKKEVFKVDEDFECTVKSMFEDLAASDEYAKFSLPPGLSNVEVDFVKSLASDFKGLIVDEVGEGRKRKVTIIKQVI